MIKIDINLDLGRVSMAERVRARRLSDEEGCQLQQIVRRGKHGSIRVRRAWITMASASGTPVPAIARLVQADEDTVRQVIHRFNEIGLACLATGIMSASMKHSRDTARPDRGCDPHR